MSKTIKKIILLGGYGNFGKRIAQNLCLNASLEIFIAGRNLTKGQTLCDKLNQLSGNNNCQPLALDIFSPTFEQQLIEFSPDLLIHTSGPFQGQDYRVALACINSNCHYIDLADDRRFVCDIDKLNEQAKDKNLLLVSGASSVPGLSSSVIKTLNKNYAQLETIDIAISPGNKAERGKATLNAILSYTGQPIAALINHQWQNIYGWMSSRKVNFGKHIGNRWLANVDVPDLELFAKLYPQVSTVQFQAGLELPLLHHTMVFMGWLAKHKIVKNWAKYTTPILKLSELFYPFGTDLGAMRIVVTGINHQQKYQSTTWTLIAKDNIGPFIPTLAAIILTNKLINNQIDQFGALACTELFSLDEFDHYAIPLGIFHHTESIIMEKSIG